MKSLEEKSGRADRLPAFDIKVFTPEAVAEISSVDAETMGREVHHSEPGRGFSGGKRRECPQCHGTAGYFSWVKCGRCSDRGSVLVTPLEVVK